MGAVEVRLYLDRAQDFLQGMQLLREDKAYRTSSALLGIHSAVAYSDALRAGLGDESMAAEDHQIATKALRRLLSDRTENDSGLRHLESLLSKKHAVAYGNRRLTGNDFELIFTQAERFAKWVNGMGSQLKVEGWRYAD